MIFAVIGFLLVLGLLDGAFSGFRASLGRTGLVDHGANDRLGLLQGTGLFSILALPSLILLLGDLASGDDRVAAYADAGATFLLILGPYALVVILALASYGAMGWQYKYLASALILGPFTLIRPYVVLAAATFAVVGTSDTTLAITAALATAAVLLVEPITNRRLSPRTNDPRRWFAMGATSQHRRAESSNGPRTEA